MIDAVPARSRRAQDHVLRDLIALSEKILGRKGSSLDLADAVRDIEAEVQAHITRARMYGSVTGATLIGDAEAILCLALKAIALGGGAASAISAVRFGAIAESALMLTRENFFCAWHDNPKGPPR